MLSLPLNPVNLLSNATVAPFCSNFPPRGGDGVQFSAAAALKSEKGKLSLVGLGVRSAWTGEHRRPVMLRFNGQGGRSMALAAA